MLFSVKFTETYVKTFNVRSTTEEEAINTAQSNYLLGKCNIPLTNFTNLSAVIKSQDGVEKLVNLTKEFSKEKFIENEMMNISADSQIWDALMWDNNNSQQWKAEVEKTTTDTAIIHAKTHEEAISKLEDMIKNNKFDFSLEEPHYKARLKNNATGNTTVLFYPPLHPIEEHSQQPCTVSFTTSEVEITEYFYRYTSIVANSMEDAVQQVKGMYNPNIPNIKQEGEICEKASYDIILPF